MNEALKKVLDTVSHNRYMSLAVGIGLLAAVWSCSPVTTVSPISGEKVSADKLSAEYNTGADKLKDQAEKANAAAAKLAADYKAQADKLLADANAAAAKLVKDAQNAEASAEAEVKGLSTKLEGMKSATDASFEDLKTKQAGRVAMLNGLTSIVQPFLPAGTGGLTSQVLNLVLGAGVLGVVADNRRKDAVIEQKKQVLAAAAMVPANPAALAGASTTG